MRRLTPLNECLWDAFVRDTYSPKDPQEMRQFWAIREGLERLEPRSVRWKETHARKDHVCIRGCHIRDGERYFQRETNFAWGTANKFCATCLAMILYVAAVVDKPVAMFTHWDEEACKPVNPEAEERSRASWERFMAHSPEEQRASGADSTTVVTPCPA